jgi:exodeoxyribonuclease VII small subunit
MKKQMTYGEALKEMEEILSRIENQQLDVDDLSKTVDRVAYLLKLCRDKLRKTESEVDKILDDMNDEPATD